MKQNDFYLIQKDLKKYTSFFSFLLRDHEGAKKIKFLLYPWLLQYSLFYNANYVLDDSSQKKTVTAERFESFHEFFVFYSKKKNLKLFNNFCNNLNNNTSQINILEFNNRKKKIFFYTNFYLI